MSDRTRSLIVTLDDSYRDDDVDSLKDAITMMKGVYRVDHKVDNIESHLALQSLASEVRLKLHEAINDIFQ